VRLTQWELAQVGFLGQWPESLVRVGRGWALVLTSRGFLGGAGTRVGAGVVLGWVGALVAARCSRSCSPHCVSPVGGKLIHTTREEKGLWSD